jgi:hypothetical protein
MADFVSQIAAIFHRSKGDETQGKDRSVVEVEVAEVFRSVDFGSLLRNGSSSPFSHHFIAKIRKFLCCVLLFFTSQLSL